MANHWTPWNGGECPINRDCLVWLRFRQGWRTKEPVRAGNYIWRHRGWDFDVTAYYHRPGDFVAGSVAA